MGGRVPVLASILTDETAVTFDTMGDLTFNESFGCLDRGDFHEWVGYLFETIKDGAKIQATRRVAGVDTWFQGWLVRRFQGMGEALGYHLKHTREKVLKYVSPSE